MSILRRYTITEEQATKIREALSTCDGDWWIAVRWGDGWEADRRTKTKGFDTLFGSDGTHIAEGIEGVESALCFGPKTTILGEVHTVLECADVRGIQIGRRGRIQAQITDLAPLKDCLLVHNIVLHNSTSLVDISALSSLVNLHTIHISGGRTLVDISPLSSLDNLRNLHLSGCRALVDISALSSLNSLDTLTMRYVDSLTDISALSSLDNLHALYITSCRSLVDISPLAALTNLQILSIHSCESVVDFFALSSLENLHTLDLSQCASLVDISPLATLTNLQVLSIHSCESIVDVSALSPLENLKDLSLNFCKFLVNISPLSSLNQLEILHLSWCTSVADISALSSLDNLHTLNLSNCYSLVDIAPLATLTNLQSLDLSQCAFLDDIAPLANLVHIQTLRLGGDRGTPSLVDISPLATLTNLQHLTFSRCRFVGVSSLASLSNLQNLEMIHCDSLVDISPLSNLPNLQSLRVKSDALIDVSLSNQQTLQSLSIMGDARKGGFLVCISLSNLPSLQILKLSDCSSLVDISVTNLPNLQTLSMNGNRSLVDISALSTLQNLKKLSLSGNRKGNSLVDVSPLNSLLSLQTLDLSNCTSLVDIPDLSSLENLHTLNLNGCRSLFDISGLSSLEKLEALDLGNCNELADNRTWIPLTTLPTLMELKGSFPGHFTTKIVARNAANMKDWQYITQHRTEWMQTAKSSPNEPNLLTQVGRACAIHPDGYNSLATIISLSTTNDASQIDVLFATAVPLAVHELIGSAIQSAVAQSKQPLPPETLVALHNHLPSNTTLRDSTISALTRSISQESVPEWGEKTAKTLREHLNDSRYPVTSSVHDDGLAVLFEQQFSPIQSQFFGVLCSGHARSTDIGWRNHVHNLLCELALSQSKTSTRNQALSDISAGLAVCGDASWVQKRLDYLLKAAAKIDPDTSVIYAAVAHAHATSGRWDEAQETVSGIASPSIRDASLNKLCAMVLDSSMPDKMQRAISCTDALSEPMERAQKLYDIGFHDGILEDLVAYGLLVGLLTEFPEKQKEVVAHVTKQNPDMMKHETKSDVSISYEDCRIMLRSAFPSQYHAILDCITTHVQQGKQT